MRCNESTDREFFKVEFEKLKSDIVNDLKVQLQPQKSESKTLTNMESQLNLTTRKITIS